MTTRRRLVFVGAYGLESAGDDAPLLVLTRGLRAAYPEVEFDCTVFSRHPDALIERLAGCRFMPNPEYPSREAARGKGFRGLNPGDERADLERIEEEIRAADLVVAGAGNILADLALDLFRGPIPLLGLYSFLADVHRTPLFLYGISAGPIRTRRGRELSAWIARRAAGVTVRDQASRELMDELAPEVAVSVLPDAVLALEPADEAAFERALAEEGIPRRPQGPQRPRLALALRDLEFLGVERSLVVETLRRLAPRWEFLFVPQCTYPDCDDRREAEAVIRALGEAARPPWVHVVRGRHAPDVLMRFYETARATLAIRLHGAVFSALAGVPVVGLSYLPKVRGFLERVGLEHSCFELASATPEVLSAAVEAASGGQRALARRARDLARGVGEYALRAGKLMGLSSEGAQAIHALGTPDSRPASAG